MAPIMMDDTASAKAVIRAKMLARRSAQPGVLRALRSRAIARRASRLSAIACARLVLAYFPVRGEVDTRPLIDHCLRRGRSVALPRSVGRGRKRGLAFERVTGLGGLAPGRFGIPEPAAGTGVALAWADAIIVPGVAFSFGGGRIGYGGGYYDRVLRARRGVAIGVAFDSQLLAQLPQTAGDVAVDALVTERRVLIFGVTPNHR